MGQTREPASTPGRQEQVVSAKPAQRAPAFGRGTWTDLDGAVNDAIAFKELLVARFGFRATDIILLTNAEATREGILGAFRKHLVEQAQRDDVALFFYAGHGSRVRNSRTDEPDGMDEALVPEDSYKGMPDIRDKELSRLFNVALDKGVSLTVIADSCHSGSIARGLPRPGKYRYLPPDYRDVADPPDGAPHPEERGALVFSAAQDDQLAGEMSDDSGNSHGAFSLALFKTLQTASPTMAAQDVFLKVKALMQSEGRMQEPVIAGIRERRQMPLFEGGGATRYYTRVAVLRKAPGNRITLQGGLAVGLREGCQLRGVPAPGETLRARLRISRVTSLSFAEAEVIEGSAEGVSVGDIFEVDRWVAGDSPLRVWWPSLLPTRKQLKVAVERLSPLERSSEVDWVDDPTATTPTHVVVWNGSGWQLNTSAGLQSLGVTPSSSEVLKCLKSAPNRSRLFVQIPPDREFAARLRLGEGSTNDAVLVAHKPSDALYLLVGRVRAGEPEYAWLIPNLTQEDTAGAPFALPVRTDWLKESADLEEQALRLRGLRAWLQLESPADPGMFPYHLTLRNDKTGLAQTDGIVRGGEGFGVVLRAREEDVARGIERRYVYVFVIDSFGNSTLLFPSVSRGNAENRVPYESTSDAGFPTEISLGKSHLFKVGPPFGVDTYFLLSTVQPIPDPTVLQFSGVRKRAGAADSPLARLLARVGSARRGLPAQAPADWSVDRLSLRSAPVHQ